MFNGIFNIPKPTNEKVLSYAPGSPERAELKAALQQLLTQQTEVPMVIGGKEVHGDTTAAMVCPHDHQHELGQYHLGDAFYVEQAI